MAADVVLTLAFVEDGYLAAAEYGIRDEDYFMDLIGEDLKIAYVEVGLPLAKKLVVQGTLEQWFSDGYEAADAVEKHLAARRRRSRKRRPAMNRW